MKIKRRFTRLFFVLFAVFLIMFTAACGNNEDNLNADSDRLNVVTSFYPLQFFSNMIGGEHVHVIQLVPSGVDPHDWTPKLRDMANTTKADVFVYNGAGFEVWIDSFLDSVETDALIVEASRGIQLIEAGSKHEEDRDHHHDHDVDDHRHGAYDPHVWTSPKQAMVMAKNILDAFISADPDNKAIYEANYADLIVQLEKLDELLHETVETSKLSEIVVTHQSFAYMARDYGFRQVAVMGLSPQAEPTVRDLQRISSFIKEHSIQYILFEELVSPKLAETLAADLGIETLVLNPLEGLTEEQLAAGEDYVSIMHSNIETLQKALQ